VDLLWFSLEFDPLNGSLLNLVKGDRIATGSSSPDRVGPWFDRVLNGTLLPINTPIWMSPTGADLG
jgi:hypothetical protein